MSASSHPRLWLAGRAATIAGAMVAERIRPQAPSRRTDVPRDAADITQEWLTDVLCHEHPGAAVDGFEITPGTSQTTSRAAVRVSYNQVGRDAGLPADLFVKT